MEIPSSLEQQAELTRVLQTARPVVQEMTVDELLGQIDRMAPIWITAQGPTYREREMTANTCRLGLQAEREDSLAPS